MPNDEWEPQFAPESEVRARRLNITKEDIESEGPTPGWQKCEDVLAGRDHNKAHSERCGKRFVEILARSEAGKRRLLEEEKRLNDSSARINEADLRRLEARMDADDRMEAVAAKRKADELDEKDRTIKEAERYLRSGRPMPEVSTGGDQDM